MSTNYDYIHESDVNRLAYILCGSMDCRKCPIGYGHDCQEELKEWLNRPLGNLQNVKTCPICGKRVTTERLLSDPMKYRVRCGCLMSGVRNTQEEAFESWETRVKAKKERMGNEVNAEESDGGGKT